MDNAVKNDVMDYGSN